MHVYRGPFKFQVEPYTDYYNQFSSQERNIGEDIHSTGPSLESNEDEEFWWMFAALFVVICFLILLFGLSLQLLARAILRHNQVQPTVRLIKHESWRFFFSAALIRKSYFTSKSLNWKSQNTCSHHISKMWPPFFGHMTVDLQVVPQPSWFVGYPVVEVKIKHLLLIKWFLSNCPFYFFRI